MNKKTGLLALLTLAICLSACTPAAPETQTEAPVTATAETAAAADSTRTETFTVAGNLQEVSDANLQDGILYTVWFGDTPEDTTFVQVDLNAERQTPICKLEDWGTSYVGWLVKGDSFYYLIYDEDGNAILHNRSLKDGSETVWTLAANQQYPAYLDDRYLYFSREDYNAAMKRVDLTTGVLEDLPLPAGTSSFQDVESGRFLITRSLTPVPLTVSPMESEEYDALMQNAEVEYCWWDPATGALERVLREPYYGEMDAQGNRINRIYLGKADGKLYFYRASVTDTGMSNSRVERCALDGSQMETAFTVSDGGGAPSALKREGEIHWLLQPSPNGVMVYLPATGEVQEVTGPAGNTLPWAERCLPDGKLLLPRQDDGSWTVVSEEDYLAGNFTGTTIPAP